MPDRDKPIITSGRTLDYAAGVYDLLSPIMTFYQEGRLSRKAMSLLRLNPQDKVLDIGCGTGTLTIKIAKGLSCRRARSLVIGLDAAPKMIAVARKKARAQGLENIRFDIQAAEDLPYADNYFDAAVSTFFFHHIDYNLKLRALREIRRVLKKGKQAVLVDVDTPTNIWGAFCAWCGYIIFCQKEIKENIQGKLAEAIAASGFSQWQRVSRHMGFVSIFLLRK